MKEWEQFEYACADLLRSTFPAPRWEVRHKVPRTYADGSKTLDIHVYDTTRRGGGFRWIFECKHKPSGLTKDDVDQAHDYKRRGHASAVTLLISSGTLLRQTVQDYADRRDVSVLYVDWGDGKLRQLIRDVQNRRRLSWHTQIATSGE